MQEKLKRDKNGLSTYIPEVVPLLVAAITFLIFLFAADSLLANIPSPLVASLLFLCLFVVMLWAAFGVVRHADALAEIFGEPYGTLILTLSAIGIEVSLISAVMLTGDTAPTLARDTMLAILMIVLNGLVGLALLMGGIRHMEQDYNLQGARAFMVVLLPLAVLSLVLPKFTISTDEPTFSTTQSLFFAVITISLYLIFLAIQTGRHRGYFQEPYAKTKTEENRDEGHHSLVVRSWMYHTVLLMLTLLSIVLLSKRLAKLVDYGIVQADAPIALGGVIIALMVLAPEGLSTLRAARANHLQRSVNLMLGAALSTIGLTVPAVLLIGLLTDHSIVLGLSDASTVLLLLTLIMSSLTFGGVRTGVLQGAVHLVIFLAYLMLIFKP